MGLKFVLWLVLASVTGFVLVGNAVIQMRVSGDVDLPLLRALAKSGWCFLCATATAIVSFIAFSFARAHDANYADAKADLLEGVVESDRPDALTSPAMRTAERAVATDTFVAVTSALSTALLILTGMAIPMYEVTSALRASNQTESVQLDVQVSEGE